MDPMYKRPCKLCGRELLILVTPENKMLALDMRAKCYAPTTKNIAVETKLSFVDHMEVCKKLPDAKIPAESK